MKKKIFLITQSYPYIKSETFVGNELKYWIHLNSQFLILPFDIDLEEDINPSLNYDEFLNTDLASRKKFRDLTFLAQSIYLLRAMFSKVLRIEVSQYTKVNFRTFIQSYRYVAVFLYHRDFFKLFLHKNIEEGADIIFYTYWYTNLTNSLLSLKKEFNFKVVTRMHGSDLHLERTINGFFPLRNQFINNIDTIYAISSQSKNYITKNFNINNREKVIISKLGVENPGIVSNPSEAGKFHIVSCSSAIKLKRLDIILEVIYELSKYRPEISFIWTHIGDGVLLDDLKLKSFTAVNKRSNFKVNLLGRLQNDAIMEFYKETCVDLFINASSTEGVPVSIMEALSFGIPIIAPDIGGISELVNNGKNGFLVSSNKSKFYLYYLGDLNFYKKPTTRNHSLYIYNKSFNSTKNYVEFIDSIIKY